MKKKVFDKFHSLKVDGLTKRWLLNIILVVVIVLAVTFTVACVTIKNYYYNSVENILKSGASTNAVNYFSNNLDSGTSLESSAVKFIDNYAYKEKTTVWVIDNNGRVLASSNGFLVSNTKMEDYDAAKSSDSGTGKYVGKIYDGGDKVMALTRVIQNSAGANVGAVRVMTNIEDVDSQIFTVIAIMLVLVLFVFAIILLSNLFFIRSIIIPVKQITKTTNEIAHGNLNAVSYTHLTLPTNSLV